jgi:hypothetical protein
LAILRKKRIVDRQVLGMTARGGTIFLHIFIRSAQSTGQPYIKLPIVRKENDGIAVGLKSMATSVTLAFDNFEI